MLNLPKSVGCRLLVLAHCGPIVDVHMLPCL